MCTAITRQELHAPATHTKQSSLAGVLLERAGAMKLVTDAKQVDRACTPKSQLCQWPCAHGSITCVLPSGHLAHTARPLHEHSLQPVHQVLRAACWLVRWL